AAFFFIQFGGMKLFGWFGGMDGQGAAAELATLMGAAGILEVFGGALILLGLFTRPVAFLLAGEMAFAYFLGHFSMAFWPVQNGGIGAVLYCFLFLHMAAKGAGGFSLDSRLDRRKMAKQA